jgi:hypothetical protein
LAVCLNYGGREVQELQVFAQAVQYPVQLGSLKAELKWKATVQNWGIPPRRSVTRVRPAVPWLR